ncbi:MAG TPA: energy transducer TonB [Methylophilaceae bacterium]
MTLIGSAVLHAALILLIKFEMPDLQRFKDNMPALEIILVNTKTKSAPEKADALAQANLDRGGNTDENRRAKSALPVQPVKPDNTRIRPVEVPAQTSKQADVDAAAERQMQRVAELERQAQALLTQAKSRQVVQSEPLKQEDSPQPERNRNREATSQTLDRAALAAAIADMARLEAQIAKQQEEYQTRPRRKFIGARTQEYRFATYIEAWRQKVERVGNLNYPEAAREQKIYGQLRMTVSIKADGSIEKVEINQSSGHRILDDAALRIVELAAPFAPFPEDIRRDTDILSITRTWTFTRQDSLSAD